MINNLKTKLTMSVKLLLLLPLLIIVLGSCTDDNKKDEKVPEDTSFSWKTASTSEVEKKLKEACKSQNSDLNSLVSSVRTNENVADAFASNDKQSLIVKFKGEEIYTAYPVKVIGDPFAGADAQEASAAPYHAPRKASSKYKKTGSRGVVAVFNYFSYLTNRKAQNQILEYMMQDLNDHNYGVEYYPYEEMTYNNIRNVKQNSENYVAVIVMSHGVSDGKNSYFAIGEEYSSFNDLKDKWTLIENKDQPKEENPWYYRMYNGEDLWGGQRYDCMLAVNNMFLSENTILYMGSCNAFEHYSNDYLKNYGGTCIGWDGVNCSAQAHVAVLFYKLMRGKTLRGALDLNDQLDPYSDIATYQTDTWTVDPLYPNKKLKWHMDGIFQMGETKGGIYYPKAPPYSFSGDPGYYKKGRYYVDATKNHDGVYFQYDRNIHKMYICMKCDDASVNDDLFPKAIYIKATPLRAGAKEKIVKLKRKKKSTTSKYIYEDFSMSFPSNCPYVLTAAVDEDFTREIMFFRPMVLLFAESFKGNGVNQESPEEEGVETETFTVNGVSFDMVNVEGGTFWMGSADDDPDAHDDEKPRHQVSLSSFSIGQTEVTQALWEAVMGNNPSSHKGVNRPVENVSWNDCQEFITKLNAMTSRTFRLPTEAEWEYAARGGIYSQGYIYAGSNNIDEVGWSFKDIDDMYPCPVAQKQANELGLYDMSGNVSEWCQDWYDEYYYSNSPSIDPCNNVEAAGRVFRGGSRSGEWLLCRVTYRACKQPDNSNGYRGLRLAQ